LGIAESLIHGIDGTAVTKPEGVPDGICYGSGIPDVNFLAHFGIRCFIIKMIYPCPYQPDGQEYN
jgi:hypothetical protein